MDVDSVIVAHGRVGALPGGDAAAAGAEDDLGGLDEESAEAVQEVGLAR